MTETQRKEPVIALLGQPNSGKSTLFNGLTGLKQHVGNWPGKTVEQKAGYFVRSNQRYTVVNRQILLGAGILPEHISMPNLCTCCNPEFLYSHRASQGKRGNLGAFLGIKR